jgi:hypothetical protein
MNILRKLCRAMADHAVTAGSYRGNLEIVKAQVVARSLVAGQSSCGGDRRRRPGDAGAVISGSSAAGAGDPPQPVIEV